LLDLRWYLGAGSAPDALISIELVEKRARLVTVLPDNGLGPSKAGYQELCRNPL